MSLLSKLAVIASILVAAPSVFAEPPHAHDRDEVIAGPRGGRLLENIEPHTEVLIENDRSVTVAFYDDELKPVAVAQQEVVIVAQAGGTKATLDFEKKGDVLVSKGALPAEEPVNLVVQFKQRPDDKPRNYRFTYEDHVCEMCKRAEYACICGH